jgi:hypothetical protein
VEEQHNGSARLEEEGEHRGINRERNRNDVCSEEQGMDCCEKGKRDSAHKVGCANPEVPVRKVALISVARSRKISRVESDSMPGGNGAVDGQFPKGTAAPAPRVVDVVVAVDGDVHVLFLLCRQKIHGFCSLPDFITLFP